MANGDSQQTPTAAPQVPDHLADLRIQPETTLQTVKRNITPELDTSRAALGPGHEFASESPQAQGEQQYRESLGSPLERAYGHAKNFLATHEKSLSDKYLAPFRTGLDRMADDLEEAASSGRTKSGGSLTPVTRALAGGTGAALRMVPVGKNVQETAQMAVTPPELGIEGKALSKGLKAGRSLDITGLRIREVGAEPNISRVQSMEPESFGYMKEDGTTVHSTRPTTTMPEHRVALQTPVVHDELAIKNGDTMGKVMSSPGGVKYGIGKDNNGFVTIGNEDPKTVSNAIKVLENMPVQSAQVDVDLGKGKITNFEGSVKEVIGKLKRHFDKPREYEIGDEK